MRCEVHGDDCPDQVVKLWKNKEFGLEGRNASYSCYFCPACGFELKKLLK